MVSPKSAMLLITCIRLISMMADIYYHTFINPLDPEIVPQITRFINKIPPQSIMHTGSEHVVELRNASF